MNATLAQPPAAWNVRRRDPMGVPAALAQRKIAQRACKCHRSRQGGDYIDPHATGAMDNAGMGSWLSEAFHSVTGSKLSDVIAPIATVAGSVLGGPIGGIVGSIAGGIASGGGSGQQQQVPQQQQAAVVQQPQNYYQPPVQPYYMPQAAGPSITDLVTLVTTLNRSSAAPAAAPPPTVINASGSTAGIDNKTLVIGGAVLFAAVLLSRR